MLIADSCSIILLAKATLLEAAAETYKIAVTKDVLEEVTAGKKHMSADALLVERLYKERKLQIEAGEARIAQKLAKDFNMGLGEASTIAAALKERCIVATDNRQGRKAAFINSLPLVGSPEIAVSLWKKGKITREKAKIALNVLKKEGWFDPYIIEKAMEDLK